MLGSGGFERIAARISVPGQTLHAPHLLDVEVAHALRRLSLQHAIGADRALEALADFRDLRVRRYGHGPLLTRIWDLRSNVSSFDAAYIALAEALNAPLITADAAMGRAPGHSAVIEVLR